MRRPAHPIVLLQSRISARRCPVDRSARPAARGRSALRGRRAASALLAVILIWAAAGCSSFTTNQAIPVVTVSQRTPLINRSLSGPRWAGSRRPSLMMYRSSQSAVPPSGATERSGPGPLWNRFQQMAAGRPDHGDRERMTAIAKTFERQGRTDSAQRIYAMLEGRPNESEPLRDRIKELVQRPRSQGSDRHGLSELVMDLAPSDVQKQSQQSADQQIDLAGTFDDKQRSQPAGGPQPATARQATGAQTAEASPEDDAVELAATMMGWKPRETKSVSKRPVNAGEQPWPLADAASKKSAQTRRPTPDDGHRETVPLGNRRDDDVRLPSNATASRRPADPRQKGTVQRPRSQLKIADKTSPVRTERGRSSSEHEQRVANKSSGPQLLRQNQKTQNPFADNSYHGPKLATVPVPANSALSITAAPQKASARETSQTRAVVEDQPVAGTELNPPGLNVRSSDVGRTPHNVSRSDAAAKSGPAVTTGRGGGSGSVANSDSQIRILPATKLAHNHRDAAPAVADAVPAAKWKAFAATNDRRSPRDPEHDVPATARNEAQPMVETDLPQKPAELAAVPCEQPLPAVVPHPMAADEQEHEIIIIPAGADMTDRLKRARQAKQEHEALKAAALNQINFEQRGPAELIADKRLREIHTPQVLLQLGALTDPDPRQRALGVFKLGQAGNEARTVLPMLRSMLESDQDPIVRVRVAEAIARISQQDEQAIAYLSESLSCPSDWKVRELAACALEVAAPTPNEQVVSKLIAAMDDFHPGVRTMAALTLASFGEEAGAALPRLETATRSDVGKVKEAAAAAIPLIHSHAAGNNSPGTEDASP